jgi:putative phosphoesterase
MLIGVIADSHDDMEQIKKVVDLFNDKGVAQVLHAGDLISPFTFEVLGTLRCPFTGIFGNNDGDKLLLNEKSKGSLHNPPLNLLVDRKRVVIVHEPSFVEALSKSGSYDLVIYGHTHTPEIRKVGGTKKAEGTIVLNPGKVARLHKGRSTAALLETKTMNVEFVAL